MNSSGQVVDFTLKLDVSDTEVLELLRGRKSRVASTNSIAKTSISARYLSGLDTITLTSLLHKRFPVNFKLKPGSRSYTNFLKLLIRELSEEEALSDYSFEPGMLEEMEELRSHLVSVLGNSPETEPGELGQQSANLEVIDLYRGDFELLQQCDEELMLPDANSSDVSGLQVLDCHTGERLFKTQWTDRTQKFRFFGESEPLLISGFVDQEAQSTVSLNVLRPMFDDWRSVVMFHPEMQVSLQPGEVKLSGRVAIPERLRSTLELFVHWGRRSTKTWRDEEIAPFELTQGEGDWLTFEKRLRPEQLGEHGITLCAQVIGTTQRLWSQDLGIADYTFTVSSSTLYSTTKRVRERRALEADMQSKLLRSMNSFPRFLRAIDQLARSGKERRLAKLLHEVSHEDDELRNLLDSFHKRIETELAAPKSAHSKSMLRRVLQVLRTIGIGELVFITPEGPHAIAGGLAQVIVGLTKALSREGVPTTIIAPLYENAQGSKHQSAEDLLANGVVLADQRVPVELCGEIKIIFGATRIAGTLKQQQFARVVPVQVYKAERGSVRLFLLRHHTLADALYSFSSGQNALRKAVFLSRGALELLRSRHFDIVPDTIISNDWLAALAPIYLRCDPRYAEFGAFEEVKTVHMLHNAGPAFQGRLYVNEFGEDLWPIISLADQHFFWLSEPHSQDHLNLTAGAVRHLSGALLTVSQPYAGELFKEEVGGSLSSVLKSRADIVYGISNGVDTDALRLMYRELGEEARAKADLPPIFRAKTVRPEAVVRKLPEIKATLKRFCQQKFALEERSDAALLSMVGRLTTQKGVQLLTGQLLTRRVMLLEDLLLRHPRVQVLVAGPLGPNEHEVEEFHRRFNQVVAKFPGRIAGYFDFIPHREALAITCASDLFMMPSQYEPGGITQLEALSAGTSVVGHAVGGIAATLRPFWPEGSNSRAEGATGDSFLFTRFTPDAFSSAIERAVSCLADPTARALVCSAAAKAEHDWRDRMPQYFGLLHATEGIIGRNAEYHFLRDELETLRTIRP